MVTGTNRDPVALIAKPLKNVWGRLDAQRDPMAFSRARMPFLYLPSRLRIVGGPASQVTVATATGNFAEAEFLIDSALAEELGQM